jgi:hypothetical protein
VLFKCDWFQSKNDGFGFTLVNFEKLIYENDPFVFAAQVKPVYYVEDPCDNWHVITNTIPRDLFDIYGDLDNGDIEKDMIAQLTSPTIDQSSVEDEHVNWFRDDIPGVTIDTYMLDHQGTGDESQEEFEDKID